MKQRPTIHHEECIQCEICGDWLKAITWAHLRKHHIEPSEYKETYQVEFLLSPASRVKLAHGVRHKKSAPYVPRMRKDVLQKLRQIRKQLDGKASATAVNRFDVSLTYQAIRHFGNLRTALKAAGFTQDQIVQVRFWNQETLSSELSLWVKKHGPLNATRLRDTDSGLYASMSKFYSRIEDAAEELQLPFDRPYLRWTKSSVLENLKAKKNSKQVLNISSILKHEPRLYGAACRLFKSFRAALKAAGFTQKDIHGAYQLDKWNDDRMRKSLTLYLKKHKTLNYTTMCNCIGSA